MDGALNCPKLLYLGMSYNKVTQFPYHEDLVRRALRCVVVSVEPERTPLIEPLADWCEQCTIHYLGAQYLMDLSGTVLS